MLMTRTLIFSSLLFLATACTDAPESDKAEATDAVEVSDTTTGNTYTVNTNSSNIEWVGTKVSGYHSGNLRIKSGSLIVDNNQVVGGNFVINMSSIQVTGPEDVSNEMNQKLLGHLKSPDFFDVEKNPEATFTITGVQPFSGSVNQQDESRQESINKYKVSDPTHTITGNLNIKGVNKNISFPAKIDQKGDTIEAMAKFNIDRTEWNIVYPGQPDDLIRKDVHLGILLTATK
jgi:polyisoprenoid-binding protein YceI